MKKITICILLFFSINSFSQITSNDDAVYLDSLYNIGDEKNYMYIQIIKDFKVPNKEIYEMGIYYKSGKIKMKGTTSTGNRTIKNGQFLYFYENGKRNSIINYENNTPAGTFYEFHENGEKKLVGVLVDNEKNVIPNVKIKNGWDQNGIQTIFEGTGFFEESYYDGSLIYKNSEQDFGSGKIVNNLKDSIWNGYNKKTKISYRENYKNGELIEGVSIDSNKVENKYTNLNYISPYPKKGMDDFHKYFFKNLNIPNKINVNGKMYIFFVIDIDGELKDFKVKGDLGYGIGDEAIWVIKHYGKWIPGEHRGVKVRKNFCLPIKIEYQN